MARPGDEGAVLNIIRALARYEHLEDQVIATEGLLREWLFEKEKAEVETHFRCSLYSDFDIALEDIFSGLLP